MGISNKQNVINILNKIQDVTKQLNVLKQDIDIISLQATQLSLGTVVGAFVTAPINADGSFGVADGQPNSSNAIDNRLTDQGLNVPMSLTDLAGLLTALQQVSALLGGSAASTETNFPKYIAQVINT